jgi:hypothetical protein
VSRLFPWFSWKARSAPGPDASLNELKKEPKMIELGAEVIDVKAEGFKYIVTLDSGVEAFGLQVRCVKEASVFGGRSCDSRNRGS